MNGRAILTQLPGDLREMGDLALDKGWKLEKLQNNHIRWSDEKGNFVTVTASTPSDHRAIKNEVAALRRGGLREETVPPKPVENISKDSVIAAVAAHFQENPLNVYGLQQIKENLENKLPNITVSTIGVTLHALLSRGDVTRVGRGLYKKGPGYPVAAVEPPPVPIPPPPAPTPAAPALGTRTGDPAFDEELERLERALVALAEIEGVVVRVRKKIEDIAEFKKRLMGI